MPEPDDINGIRTLSEFTRLDPGIYVHDRDDESDAPSQAVVIRRPTAVSNEYVINDAGKTVADVNPDYDPEAPVVEVAFVSDLDAIVDGWEVSTPESIGVLASKKGVKTYAYPKPRLEQAGVALTPRRTDDGNRYIHRLRVSGVGDRLVYGEDFDGVNHAAGVAREVCFHTSDWDVEEENVVHVEYGREKTDIEGLPPMLVEVSTVEVVEETATPDFLFDL